MTSCYRTRGFNPHTNPTPTTPLHTSLPSLQSLDIFTSKFVDWYLVIILLLPHINQNWVRSYDSDTSSLMHKVAYHGVDFVLVCFVFIVGAYFSIYHYSIPEFSIQSNSSPNIYFMYSIVLNFLQTFLLKSFLLQLIQTSYSICLTLCSHS